VNQITSLHQGDEV